MQSPVCNAVMGLLEVLHNSISKVGIKEVARRSGLSPSTVSRVRSGQINPSLEVVEKISAATGFLLKLEPDTQLLKSPRLKSWILAMRKCRRQNC